MSRKFRGWAKMNAPANKPEQQPNAIASPEPNQSHERSDSSPSLSPAKVAANRANAQLSTGAVTATGKATVSQNATKHGLTGKFHVAPDESQQHFDALLAGFMQAEKPADQEEVQYVQYMAEATWLSRRAVRLQDQAILTMQCGTPEEKKQAAKDLALYMRYMTTHDRAYSRYATELRKHRNDRIKTERGFVSQKLKEAADQRRHELHQARQALQNLKLQAQEIRNRTAAAKAEALELKNLSKKSNPVPQNATEGVLAAAA